MGWGYSVVSGGWNIRCVFVAKKFVTNSCVTHYKNDIDANIQSNPPPEIKKNGKKRQYFLNIN